MIILLAIAQMPPVPTFLGDTEGEARLAEALRSAMASTEAYGPWPAKPWSIRLHENLADYQKATGAPTGRAAVWVGDTLHLRPWEQLKRRDIAAILRHELVHRRLIGMGLRPWEEEAYCIHAETHTRPLTAWPEAPLSGIQDRIDRALRQGTTAEQTWAYRCLRAWLKGEALPKASKRIEKAGFPWRLEPASTERMLTVCWPPERVKGPLVVNGQSLAWKPGYEYRFQGEVRFGEGAPIRDLKGHLEIRAKRNGWLVSWTLPEQLWIAAATEGELGADAPREAKRALAAVLSRWLEAHPQGNHEDGSFCPLTHCAVVRGMPSSTTLDAAQEAPSLELDGAWAFFCGSKGGVSLSPREVWGAGPSFNGEAMAIPEDRWSSWERLIPPKRVALLKRLVKPGLKPGQKGMKLGDSGPYPVEELRLAAGRAFGWTTWPSNACEGLLREDGYLVLRGHGWGHNVGLCLSTALFRARHGWKAEQILDEAYSLTQKRQSNPKRNT